MATYTWIKTTDGLWTETTSWSGGIVPLATDDVVINAGAASAYSVTLYTSGTIHDVSVLDANATFILGSHGSDGQVTAHAISVAAGTFKLNPFAKLSGATIDLAGGRLWGNGGLLSGGVVHGGVNLDHNGDDLEFTNGQSFTGAGGGGRGGIALSASGGHAYLTSPTAETLANTDIAVTAGTGVINGSGTLALTLAASVTITLASGTELDFTGRVTSNASIDAGLGDIATFGTAFTNAGSISIGGGHLLNAAGTGFANSGRIATSGGTIQVGTNQFSNTGTLALTNGLLSINQHNVAFANLGAITGSGSKLYLAYGTMDLGGATLELGSGTAFSSLQTYAGDGVFKGGTIINHGSLTQDWFGLLNATTWRGPLEVPAAGAAYFSNGFNVRDEAGSGRGHILVDGYNSSIRLQDDATIGNVVIDLGGGAATSGSIVGNAGTNSATLAATGLVQSAGDSNSANYIYGFQSFTNNGIINAAGAAVMHLQWINNTGTFVDHGTINVDGATVLFEAGTFTGDGVVHIGSGGTARVVRGTGAGETFHFDGHAGTTGTLRLDAPDLFAGTISGFHSSNAITFGSHSVVLSAGTLDGAHQLHGTIDGTTPLTLTFSGNYAGALFAITSGSLGTNQVACFVRGTRILTAKGERRVETLRIGQMVMTRDGLKPIRWIGRRSYAARFVAANPQLQPVRIAAGALGGGRPRRALLVSPLHAMFFSTDSDMLVPAGLLCNGASITRHRPSGDLRYFHIELDEHAILYAEGAPTESFADHDSRGLFENAAEFAALYPERAGVVAESCLPRVEHGLALEEVRCRLAAIARLPPPRPPGTLRGHLDIAEGPTIEGWAQDEANPSLPVIVELLAGDVVVARTAANRYRTDLEQAGIGDGRHGYVLERPAGLGGFSLRRADDGAPLPGMPQGTRSAA